MRRRPSAPEVFKVQREIGPSEGASVLVYNESRKRFGIIPTSPELETLMGDRLKIYVVGWQLPSGMVHIEALADDQEPGW